MKWDELAWVILFIWICLNVSLWLVYFQTEKICWTKMVMTYARWGIAARFYILSILRGNMKYTFFLDTDRSVTWFIGPFKHASFVLRYTWFWFDFTAMIKRENTVQPVRSGHSKTGKTNVLKTNGSLMTVNSIAEWPKRAFCNIFDLH